MEEDRREQRLPKSGQAEKPTMRRSRLSAHNLRIHTAAYPQRRYFPLDPMREARPRPRPEDEANEEQETPVNLGFSFDGLSPQDIDMRARRKASMDALKLYSGNVASLSTPMDRLIERQDMTLAKDIGVVVRDYETLDASELASELSGDSGSDDSISVGSLRPSSDTLSISREMVVESAREKKEHGTRNWRRLRMRRRNTIDKAKATRRTNKSMQAAQSWRS